ncbi:MAG TPA: hypothetical protein VM166_01750 [Gemmatimonadaceae bacterium]|nr:hypothetical protein [Gemmatimonadaceae bacterium]
MQPPDNLSTATAEKMWITWGPNSGGIAGWLLFQHHMFYFTDEGHAGSVEPGISVATWITRYRDEHLDIATELVARGETVEL